MDRSDHSNDVRIIALPEPGRCGWRVHPDQTLIPPWLVDRVDWHVRPSASPASPTPMARVLCGHVDWEYVWTVDPDLFDRRRHIGVPPPPVFFHAAATLAEQGFRLLLEVEFEQVEGQPAVAIYGAGVVGPLTRRAWQAVAGLLTTCTCTLHDPACAQRRPIPGRVVPSAWRHGDHHTWWAYPYAEPVRDGCECSAYRGDDSDRFGPRAHTGRHRRAGLSIVDPLRTGE